MTNDGSMDWLSSYIIQGLSCLTWQQIGEKHTLEVHMERVLQQIHGGLLPAGDDQCIALNTLLINDQRRAHELDKQMKKLQKIQVSWRGLCLHHLMALRAKPLVNTAHCDPCCICLFVFMFNLRLFSGINLGTTAEAKLLPEGEWDCSPGAESH